MGLPLLLLHGALGSGRQFDDIAPSLAGEFDVHAPDFPGHGGRVVPDEPLSIPLFASSVLEYLDAHRIHSVPVFGYSMGGYVALYLAAHHPERIARVLTLATKLAWSPQVAQAEAARLDPEKILSRVPSLAETLERTHAPRDWKAVLAKTADLLITLGQDPPLTDHEYRIIEIPAMLGVGERDTLVTVEETRHAAELLKNGTLWVLPATPHPFEKVDSALLAAKVTAFLQE